MTGQSGKKNFFLNYIFPLITAAFGWGLGYLISPGDKGAGKIASLQSQQAVILKEGFGELVQTIKEANISDSGLFTRVSSYGEQLNAFINATNQSNEKYGSGKIRIDTMKLYLTHEELKPGPALTGQTAGQTEKIEVETGNSNTVLIDSANYFSILKEKEATGNLAMVINGSHTSMGYGSKRTLTGSDGRPFDFVYQGKAEGRYVFIILKK